MLKKDQVDAADMLSASANCAEFTLKATLLGVLLAVVLAVSNTFLALKIGVLTASSIPAAMLSMAVLRLFKRHTILENNLVQTCASSGEAIAGGIVYTAPGLIIINAWGHFSFGLTFLLTWIGGCLGVFLIVPIRRRFMQDKELRFPEAQAISQVLIAGTKQVVNITPMLIAAGLGAAFELAQNALKLFADSATLWISKGQVVWGFGCGFSATLLGAGYLTGSAVCASVFIGAFLAHLLVLPFVSWHALSSKISAPISWHAASYAQQMLAHHVRYIGIGAMLAAGLLTLLQLLKPFYESLHRVFRINKSHVSKNKTKNNFLNKKIIANKVINTEKDIPRKYVLLGCLFFYSLAYGLFHYLLMQNKVVLGLSNEYILIISLALVLFTAVFGAIFAVICAYFSGLVGVTASPGSSVAIATILLAALVIGFIMHIANLHSPAQIHIFMALTIMLTCMVMGSACVANNNSQDLKVGHTVGATPWKQQLMLLLGVTVASCVVPFVMQLLFQAYGIVGVHGAVAHNVADQLSAPPAAALAAIAQAAFSHQLPLQDLWYGIAIVLLIGFIKLIMQNKLGKISLIGIAIGLYLPLTVSTPLCIGGLVNYLATRKRKQKNTVKSNSAQHRGVLIACGLVAGAAVMNVVLAVPASLAWHGLQLAWGGSYQLPISELLAAIATFFLARYLYRQAS